MPEPHRRREKAIDAELHILSSLTRGAVSELTEVRRRRAELIDMEAALVVGIDARLQRIDALLDERLSAGKVNGINLPTSTSRKGWTAAAAADGCSLEAARSPSIWW